MTVRMHASAVGLVELAVAVEPQLVEEVIKEDGDVLECFERLITFIGVSVEASVVGLQFNPIRKKEAIQEGVIANVHLTAI